MKKTDRIYLTELKDMLLCSCEEIILAVPYLTEIDSIIGDGDHGSGMHKGFSEVKQMLQTQKFDNCAAMLRECGMILLKSMGGASGVLFGTLFISGSDAVPQQDSMDCTAFAKFIYAGANAVQRRGKTKLGQKTMLDALIPAANAMYEKAVAGCSFEELLQCGAETSDAGAQATKDMCASVGRSKGFKAESLGIMDPGAVSVSRLFGGFYRYFSVSKAGVNA